MKPVIRRLLVPIDFSAGSRRATGYAALMATTLGATVHLLHVLEDPHVAAWGSYVNDLPERHARLVHETEEKLAAVASGFVGVRVTSEVCDGRAAREILRVADERGIDLIVMGTHGRTGLSHLMYGSVAEYVVRKAPCPVLAVCEEHMGVEPIVMAASPVWAS